MLLSRIVWQRIFALAMGNVARYRRRPRKQASKRVSTWGTGNRLWVMLMATVADAIRSEERSVGKECVSKVEVWVVDGSFKKNTKKTTVINKAIVQINY